MINKYYQTHNERLWNEACKIYQNLFEEEKDKIRKSFWGTKVAAACGYKKLLFNT